MARKMVCEWGMSDKMGPLTFGKAEEHIFLGREVSRPKDYSEETAVLIDSEIKRIVTDAASRAKHLLDSNLEKLHVLARALLERETLDGEEINRVASSPRGPSRKPPPRLTRLTCARDSPPLRSSSAHSAGTPCAEFDARVLPAMVFL